MKDISFYLVNDRQSQICNPQPCEPTGPDADENGGGDVDEADLMLYNSGIVV